ncbi:MAG: hypothetical protein J7465_03080 [Chloroflexus sp.]|nr:hypothetical protein [Chloroflexus sp.]MBO9371948.1 hypothetical protein [Chloroflexus sp.]
MALAFLAYDLTPEPGELLPLMSAAPIVVLPPSIPIVPIASPVSIMPTDAGMTGTVGWPGW